MQTPRLPFGRKDTHARDAPKLRGRLCSACRISVVRHVIFCLIAGTGEGIGFQSGDEVHMNVVAAFLVGDGISAGLVVHHAAAGRMSRQSAYRMATSEYDFGPIFGGVKPVFNLIQSVPTVQPHRRQIAVRPQRGFASWKLTAICS